MAHGQKDIMNYEHKLRENSLSGVNGLYAEIIGQLAVRHRVTRAWAYRIYKEVIDLEFKLGAIFACVFDIFRQ